MDDDATSIPNTDASRGWLKRTVLGVGVTSPLGEVAHETGTLLPPGFLATLRALALARQGGDATTA